MGSIGGCQNALPDPRKTLYGVKNGKSMLDRREWDVAEEKLSAYDENETADDGGSDADVESVLMRLRLVVRCSTPPPLFISLSSVSTEAKGRASPARWKF